ncbi:MULTISPECIES: GNAT family N-acetyltransferase [Actinosynnema]|uniref:GNAT family N-acetyltransferase n=1 Tax=Actinosynnema TaxID=40566 RepID=UPI0020A335F0|nr:GNAT family N-acetyltransferase [Actinosynnema pretiosum]MCP2098845.1 Acetyltransferase (GNAT) family protein [Actinosynnema pretiosum]
MPDDLIRRWERGWSACRGWTRQPEERGALRVLLGLPGRRRELIALRLSPELAAEVAEADEPTWLTVPTEHPAEAARTLVEAGLHVRPTREHLMTRPLPDHPAPLLPPGYHPVVTVTAVTAAAVLRVELRHADTSVAASGQAALVDGDTVFDRVETAPQHRRKGLGSAVMALLSAEAVRRGATRGVLMATPDGHALYTALGWSTAAEVVIAANTPV